ncbi:MAG: hypothetical protein LBL71_03570 [Endomicrobium sp.]|nr:hypothetical protein [Endomicrobium sp.]
MRTLYVKHYNKMIEETIKAQEEENKKKKGKVLKELVRKLFTGLFKGIRIETES